MSKKEKQMAYTAWTLAIKEGLGMLHRADGQTLAEVAAQYGSITTPEALAEVRGWFNWEAIGLDPDA